MQKLFSAFFICLSLFGLSVFGQNRTAKNGNIRLPKAATETIEQKIVRIARNYRLDPRLFQALIYTESTFKQNALSYKGAGCLTQLMPATARRFGLVVDPARGIDERFTNIEKCLSAGANYLAWLLNAFDGDVRLALAGYNAGEGAVAKFRNRIPPYRETVQYVEKICALYYGQSGHGVAMAYNQPLAQAWANDLYRFWRVKTISQVAAVVQPLPGEVALNQNQKTDAAGEDKETPLAPKKRVVTRVQLDEDTARTRLRTESLSFY